MDNKRKEICDVVTVFLDTSLNTRLATTASGGDTVSQLKRKLESEHQDLFGRIKIQYLKINRNGSLYSLSNSMHVERAVGADDECYLFADALSLDKNEESQLSASIESKDVSRDTTIRIKDTISRDVSCDMAVGNTSTFEEPCRASASNLDNRSASGGLEGTEPSQRKNEYEAMETEKHKVPDKGILQCEMCGGNHSEATCGYHFGGVPAGAYLGPLYVAICDECGIEVESRKTENGEQKWYCPSCGSFELRAAADVRLPISFADPSSPENLI